MQASAEISHKVRLAIKTKLTELGAYVDDELPDYVLVMVANRRGRQDMKKELELFLGDATDRFCSWLFGVLDKLKDAKKTAKDGKSDSEDDGKDNYDKTPPKKKDDKKEEKKSDIGSKLEKLANGGKSRDSSSPKVSKKTKKTRSPTPEKKENKKKTRHYSNRSHSRSRSRSPVRRSRRDSKKDQRQRSRTPEKPKREKKKKQKSPSPEPEKRKKDEPKEKKKKTKVSSSVVVPSKDKKNDKVNPKPTSSLIIRAINQASSGTGSSGGGLFSSGGLTRSITVKANGVTESTEVKTGSKRKSGANDNEKEEKRERKSQKDKRVFVTKNADGEVKTKTTTSNDSGSKTKNGTKVTSSAPPPPRAKSPKFFVTLHEGDKKKTTQKKKKDIIINPSDSDEDSGTENATAAIETAEKIKKQQEQNNALVSLNTQSVTLNLSSLGDSNPDARTVFVSGLDWKVGETELQEHFGIIGQVVRITILKDRYTGCSKGCAYIQYATVEQKKTACEAFDKTDFHSRQISVGDKLPPGQHGATYTARANVTTAFTPRPATASKFKYIPAESGPLRSKYQWTKPGFMPPR